MSTHVMVFLGQPPYATTRTRTVMALGDWQGGTRLGGLSEMAGEILEPNGDF